MPDRAILFIDGNNWYHSMKDVGLSDLMRLDYSKISQKLAGPRDWLETRYYIGRVEQSGNSRLYSDQRSFLGALQATDPRISVHLGRLEPRPVEDPGAKELFGYLQDLKVRIDTRVYHDLWKLARKHLRTKVMVEKAVDVMIAVDMVMMAYQDRYDAAYILSADGDYTPVAREVRRLGKKIYAASPASGAQLAAAVNTFIRLQASWFGDCYRS